VKVNVLTPVRKGGPYGWGRSLVDCVNASGRHSASHLYEPTKVLSAPVWQDADLIHTTLPLSVRFWKKPVALTVHGDYTIENNLWKRLYPAAVRMADVVTTPSRFLKERLGLDGAEVIPNAIFPEQFTVPGRRDNNTINLVTVTKFYFEDKAQGVLDLLRIIGQAGKSFDGNLKLSVVGGGKYLEPVRKKAAALDVPVRFTGFLDQPSRELGQADIFVYYSTHDNFPVTLLEAMASGLPVLTNDVGAVREIITGGSEGHISVSDEEYAENLCHLLGDARLRQAMGGRARKKAEEQYSWHTIAEKYIALYDSLRN
jgi:glycosyltransferase involved in cell wall biosynthesis